jgi:hypothetical protein
VILAIAVLQLSSEIVYHDFFSRSREFVDDADDYYEIQFVHNYVSYFYPQPGDVLWPDGSVLLAFTFSASGPLGRSCQQNVIYFVADLRRFQGGTFQDI